MYRGHSPDKVSVISGALFIAVIEYRTSKKCRGGCGGDKEDVAAGGRRVRQCAVVLNFVVSQALNPPDRALGTGCRSRPSATVIYRGGYDSLTTSS